MRFTRDWAERVPVDVSIVHHDDCLLDPEPHGRSLGSWRARSRLAHNSPAPLALDPIRLSCDPILCLTIPPSSVAPGKALSLLRNCSFLRFTHPDILGILCRSLCSHVRRGMAEDGLRLVWYSEDKVAGGYGASCLLSISTCCDAYFQIFTLSSICRSVDSVPSDVHYYGT